MYVPLRGEEIICSLDFYKTFGFVGQFRSSRANQSYLLHLPSYARNVTYTNVGGNFAGQMRLQVLGLLIIILTSCRESDNFYDVTKIIDAPDTVTLDREFDFRVTLRNDTYSKINLTIDKDVAKSIFFLPHWTCDNVLLVYKVPNPKSVDNDFQIHYLDKEKSLTFNLKGRLARYGTDSLKFTVVGSERVFRLRRPKCNNFEMTLGGMWLPGNGPLGDSMEGYYFKQDIKIRE